MKVKKFLLDLTLLNSLQGVNYYFPKGPYYFPEEGTEDSGTGEEEVNNDEEDEDEDDDEESQEELEDDDDDKEGKEKDEEPELTRVAFNDIKEKYPKFFKDFPELKHAFFREQQYSELFPTVEEAKKAAEAQNNYEEITASVVEGDAAKFLNELEIENKEGLESFTKNFLPALQEINKDLYFDVIAVPMQRFVRNVYNYGIKEKDENISNAAKIVHKIIFGGSYDDVEKEAPLLGKEGKKDDKFEKDKQEHFQKKYNELYQEVTKVLYSKLDEEIDKGLADLNKGRAGLKKILAKHIRARVLENMDKDEVYLDRMKNLWKREQRNGFSGSQKSSFNATFLGKAKAILPKIRAEARKEALGKEDTNNENEGGKRESTRVTGGRESNNNGKRMTPERARTEKLSTKDIFAAD